MKTLSLPILILHIDQDYKINYWIIKDKVLNISRVTIPQTIQLLKAFEFDLIVSEPQKLAILNSSQKVTDSIQNENSKDFETMHSLD